jgi:carboxyl-terminal processing protease
MLRHGFSFFNVFFSPDIYLYLCGIIIQQFMNFYQKNVRSAVVAVALLGLVFFAGFRSGQSHVAIVDSTGNLTNKSTGEPQSVDFSMFWKAWNVINEKFVSVHGTTTPTTDQQKVYGAIQGLAASLGDPYTVFFPPAQNEIFQSDVRGNFEGVGMEMGVQDGVLTVIAPLKDTPAYRAGIKSGDKILSIDGKTTANMSTDDAISLIRGKQGTAVTLSILHTGTKDPVEIKVVRDVINIPTITSTLLPSGVFEIDLYSFSSESPNLFRGALREFVKSGSHRLLLDLRGNPGGYLEAAIDIASWYLPPGDVVVSEDYGPKQAPTVYRSRGYDIFNKNLKFVILVDGGSASASEILAGALQEHGVATLVGVKTFGKGSVQELVGITPNTSLKVTIARWLTPNGTSISAQGLTPDVVVPVTKADQTAGKDSQKEKAIELLLGK